MCACNGPNKPAPAELHVRHRTMIIMHEPQTLPETLESWTDMDMDRHLRLVLIYMFRHSALEV